MSTSTTVEEATRAASVRRGRTLEYLTIGWNLLEVLIAVGAGLLSGSIALVGFGIDSFVEVFSGGALLWRLHLDAPERRERSEAVALKLVGVCFVLLAAYIGFDAVKSLIMRERPRESMVGIAVAALSLIVMPMLARAKLQVAEKIKSRACKRPILFACRHSLQRLGAETPFS